MKNTKNYNLQKPDFNNVADIQILNDNFDKIDTGITPFYVATLNSTNIYEVATGLSITKLNDGFSVRIAIPSDSTGAVSIIIDGLTAVPVKKANGRAVSNLKANGVYTLTYYNTSFFLSSGGADESDSTTVGTDGSKVLFGETFIGSDGEIHTGKIRNRTAVNTTLEAGQSIILYSGYYKDKSTIKAETLATAMTNAGSTLTSTNQLIKDVKAVDKNGNLVVGTATIQSLGGKKYKAGSNVATTQHVWGSGSYRVMSYVNNFRIVVGKISYKDKIFVYINDSSICSYPITVCWNNKNSQYSVGTTSSEFSPSQPGHVGIPVFYDSTNNNSIVVTNYIAWE